MASPVLGIGHHDPMDADHDDVIVLTGAEPLSIDGGPHGALVLHGFSGTPQSMRGLARALAGAGFAVELPRLPGHGTSVEDLATTTFADWLAAATRAYARLSERCDRVVVVGLSMGATLAASLAAGHPELAGLVVINGLVAPVDPAVRAALDAVHADGVARIPGPGNDVADPDQTELAYAEVPVAALVSLLDAVEALQQDVADIRCPALVIVSEQDHVVAPETSTTFAAAVGGPVERMTLTRSYHVATIDFERAEIEARVVEFARKVTT
jgi:carboxylesterase